MPRQGRINAKVQFRVTSNYSYPSIDLAPHILNSKEKQGGEKITEMPSSFSAGLGIQAGVLLISPQAWS